MHPINQVKCPDHLGSTLATSFTSRSHRLDDSLRAYRRPILQTGYDWQIYFRCMRSLPSRHADNATLAGEQITTTKYITAHQSNDCARLVYWLPVTTRLSVTTYDSASVYRLMLHAHNFHHMFPLPFI